MDTIEIDAICIRSVDYLENDKIITLYGTDVGKISMIAKGAKKPKAKLKFAASPFCFGHYYYSGKGQKKTLIGCDTYDSFYNLALDPEKFFAATVILEVLDKMGMEDDYNKDLFVVVLKALKEMCYEDVKPKEYLYGVLKDILLTLGYECNAITLIDYYNYFKYTHSININSIKELINL